MPGALYSADVLVANVLRYARANILPHLVDRRRYLSIICRYIAALCESLHFSVIATDVHAVLWEVLGAVEQRYMVPSPGTRAMSNQGNTSDCSTPDVLSPRL